MEKTVLLLFFISKVLSQNCILDVSDFQTPLIVNDDFTLPTYDRNISINFEGDELFYILCPTGTRSPYIAENGDRVACKNNTNILNIRTVEIIDFTDIKCKPSSTAIVKKSAQQCATNGTLFEIGLNVYNKFLSVIKVCFDEVKLTPLYAKYGNFYSVKFAKSQIEASNSDSYYEAYVCNGTACEWVDNGNVYPDINMDAIYHSQEEIFENLGVGNVGAPLLRFPLATSTLAYINFADDRQRIQNIPYFDYVNVVPLWNLGNRYLNSFIDTLVTSLQSDYIGPTVCTGTLGVVTLPSNNADQVEVYLSNGHQIPVPKWVWIVWDVAEQILFYYNHPDSQAETEVRKICSKAGYMTWNIYFCKFKDVIEPEMRTLIDNGFN